MTRAIFGLAAALTLATASVALAQTPEDRVKAACIGDLQKFCPDAIGKPDQVKACLRSNITRVSGGCREAAMAARS